MKELVGGKIYFSGSDVTAELTKAEMENAPVTFSNKGARMMRTKAGDILIFGGTNMSVIKPVWEEVEDPITINTIHDNLVSHREPVLDLPRMDQVQDKPKQKTADELMDEMIAKSDCKHEPEKMELYRQNTAKGIRYFPRCSFCGKRERYVAESKIVEGKYEGTPNEKWTSDDIANAIQWIED